MEEKSRDISQIENRRKETSEDENSARMKSKFETVKAIPADADEISFSARGKKNIIRGFKKRSPKATSEVKHEAETIDLKANSGMEHWTKIRKIHAI